MNVCYDTCSVVRDAVSTEENSNKCSFTSEKPSGQMIEPESEYIYLYMLCFSFFEVTSTLIPPLFV